MSTVSPRALVVLDGAAEEAAAADLGRTSLARARTAALDALARRGAVRRLRSTPPGLPAGSETGIAVLLGCPPVAPFSRGRIDAAAHGIAVEPGLACHRVDARRADGRPWPERTERARAALAAANPRHAVRPLTGHRLLAVGPGPPALPAAPAPDGAPQDAADEPHLQLWDDGEEPLGALEPEAVVLCAPRSTVAGLARLLGAGTAHPRGLTGEPGEELTAAARTAVGLLREGVPLVVVHVGSPDQAAHAHDGPAKVAALERADQELVGPLAAACADLGADLAVAPDHATDPRTGRHGAAPVPALLVGDGVPPGAGGRLTEAEAAGAPLVHEPFAR